MGPGLAFVQLVTSDRAALATTLPRLMALTARDGMIWVSWPKKVSRLPNDITEHTIRGLRLPLGLVDVKVCAVSDVRSGPKMVIQKELR